MNVRIVIGIGGTGINLAKEIANRVGQVVGEPTPVVLAVDTVRNIAGVPRENQFFLGGFDVQLAASSLDRKSWQPPELDRLRPLARGTLNMGAAATPELGRLALNVHKQPFLSWLSQAVRRAARSAAETAEVIVVGSLVGGTAAGVMPELGGLLQRALGDLRQTGWVVGLGLGLQSFSRLLFPEVGRRVAENQGRSLRWLSTELTRSAGDETRSYDTFYVVDAAGSASQADTIRRIAETVTQSWLAPGRGGLPLTLEVSENDGMLLLSLWNDVAPALNILWGSGTQFVNVPTEPEGGSFGVFFHVPAFRSRWAEQVEMLRRLISDPHVTESQIQNFLERHPDFLTGLDYHRAVPQVQLQGHNEGALIPDFMLVPFDDALADIVELKHPQHKLLVNAGRYPRFSATVAGALAQLRAYEEYFDKEENRRRLLDRYGFTAYKPRLSLVIGRSSAISSPMVFRKVAAEYPRVTVFTYDDVVAKAQRLLGGKLKS